MNKQEILEKRLKDKEEELDERQYQFEVMFHNEKNSGTFERNAINDLMIMMQLKSEIGEIKYYLMLK